MVFLERSDRKRSNDSSLPDEDSVLIDELFAYYEALSLGGRPDLRFEPQADTPWERLRQIAQKEDPERAWEIVKELLDRTPDKFLGYIGVGPLEDLVSFHGAQFIDRIEDYSVSNSRLKGALEAVVIDQWVQPDVRKRLSKIHPDIRVV